ncbi:DUF4283 domain-containing protein [Salix suchowensis]|nr:DUF4283 domain-containing protein [Salix suchowensis]
MAKSKRKPAAAVKRPGTSTAREVDGSPVDNTTASLDGVLEEGCSEEEELGEEQLDFSCSEEDYPPPSSPAPVASDIPASSTPVVPVPPARPKGATFTPSSSVQVDNPAVPPPVNGKWRDMFSSNRNISSCPKLMHFSALHDTESCPLLTEDLDHSCDDWKLCAIGYVSGKFPGYRALNNIIKNVWKCEATLTMHESGWLIYKFQNEEDKFSMLCGGPYLVYGRPLILRSMSEYFDFSSSEMTQVPVWIKFPNLPLKYWTPRCLSKLASVLGKPIQCDKLTATKERVSYARVLVEVDLLAELRSSINVTLPNGNPLIQRVIYETLPKFGKHCKVLGHSTGACSKGKAEARTVKKADPANVASEENVKDKGSVFTRLNPVVDSLVDDSPAAAPRLKAPLMLLLQWMPLSLMLPLSPQNLVWLRMCSLVPRSQLQVQRSGKLFVKGGIAQETRDRHQLLHLLIVTRHLNIMFPPRGKLLPSQLILLPIRLPFVQLQVYSPEAQF